MTDYSPAKDSLMSYYVAIEALRERCTREDGSFDYELAEWLVNRRLAGGGRPEE